MKSVFLLPAMLALAFAARAAGAGTQTQVQANYPSDAIKKGEQGTVGVTVTVGVDGRAKNCVVTKSSGSAELDKSACDQMLRYARFTPQKDDKGNPKEGTFSTNFTFKLR